MGFCCPATRADANKADPWVELKKQATLVEARAENKKQRAGKFHFLTIKLCPAVTALGV